MMMRHLLWKDAITIRPLVVAILIGIVGVNLLMALLMAVFDASRNDAAGMYVSLWILMPNLVALGAPALMVGSEEESGTLNWLRTLPVRWQHVVDSKFLVSFGAVAVTWFAASIVLMFAMAIDGSSSTYSRDLLSQSSVFHLMFFTVLLLTTGFAMAYLFRSPVTALIAVIPLIALLNGISLEFGERVMNRRFYASDYDTLSLNARYWLVFGGAVLALMAMWLLQRLLGWRRLVGNRSSIAKRWALPKTSLAYRPPKRVSVAQPSQAVALLWQQWRQLRGPALMLTAVVAFFLVCYFSAETYGTRSSARRNLMAGLAPMVIALGAGWLGSLTFYGDNVRRRCAFFADRGISPSRVWWTRITPTLICIVLLLALAVGIYLRTLSTSSNRQWANAHQYPFTIPSLLLVGFGFGQLVGQWLKRPTLAFFGAPAYSLFSCIVLAFVLAVYGSYFWTTLLMFPVLLFATWRQTQPWLDGKIDKWFHARVVGYTVLATLVPVLTVFGHRYLTTPRLDTQWRSEMLAIDDPALNVRGGARADWWRVGNNLQYSDAYPEEFVDSFPEILATIKSQLDDDGSIAFVTLYCRTLDIPSDARGKVSQQDLIDIQMSSIAVALRWARMIREDVAAGRAVVWPTLQNARVAESYALQGISELTVDLGETQELAELVSMFPSDELRDRSRRIGLIVEWRRYQDTPWKREFQGLTIWGKSFLGSRVASSVVRIPFERSRSDRFVDLTTKRLLEQLERGLPDSGSESYLETQELFMQAQRPPRHLREQPYVTLGWYEETDRPIAELRARYAGVSKQP